MHGELLKHYNLLEFLLVLSYLFIITWHRIELEDAPRRMARAVFVGAAWADVGRMRVTHAGDVGRCEPRTPARNQAGASVHVHYWTGARFRAIVLRSTGVSLDVHRRGSGCRKRSRARSDG